MQRGFEVVSEYKDKGINLPKRGTEFSAGYDFEAAQNIIIPSLLGAFNKLNGAKLKFSEVCGQLVFDEKLSEDEIDSLKKQMKPTMVPTGIKAYMQKGEVLLMFNRSSVSKRGVMLANNVPVIDADYYNNPGNEGHIYLPIWNLGPEDLFIKKGERLAQGMFQTFLLADDDNADGKRVGGYGSTGL